MRSLLVIPKAKRSRPRKARNLKGEALRRLKVTESQLQAAPDISSVLKGGQGGLKAALEAMRFSQDPNVVAFVRRYDAIPERDHKYLRWEAIAIAAGIVPAHLLGGAILAIQAYSANAVKILALTHHPEVMKKRIQFALRPNGERDRTAIQTGLGFLPTPKGSTFIINSAIPPAGTEEDEEEIEPDINYAFPSLAETQAKLLPPGMRNLEPRSEPRMEESLRDRVNEPH